MLTATTSKKRVLVAGRVRASLRIHRPARYGHAVAWPETPMQRLVHDELDAYVAPAIDLEPLLPPQVYRCIAT